MMVSYISYTITINFVLRIKIMPKYLERTENFPTFAASIDKKEQVMKNQLILKMLVIVLMSMMGTEVFAHDFIAENADGVVIYYNYIYKDSGIELEVAQGTDVYSGVVNIPEEVTVKDKTMKVTSIGEYAFGWCADLTAVSIPNSVTSIGYGAFFSCGNMASVTMSTGVTEIGDMAFFDCRKLGFVNLPEGLKTIGMSAFCYCTSFVTVTIPSTVTSIGEGAFSCNYALYRFVSLIEEPFEMESIVDEGTYRIAKLYVPAGTVDKYKNTIGWSDFEEIIENKIITLQNADGVAINYEFNFDGTELMVVNGAYSGDVNIPEEVTIDGKKQQVDVISEKAFFSCAALTSVTIPNTVNYIGYNAFYGCSGLSTITLPSSVSAIGDGAFYGIDFQSVVSLIEHPSEIYGYDDEEFTSTFSENTFNNATLYVPAGTIDRYMATEGWKKFQNIVELDPAAINAVAKKPENSAIYDLNGMRLTQPQKGINIIGGKKVIIK